MAWGNTSRGQARSLHARRPEERCQSCQSTHKVALHALLLVVVWVTLQAVGAPRLVRLHLRVWREQQQQEGG